MSTPTEEDSGILREWGPLSKLLRQIPHNIRKGIFHEKLFLTCVDALSECIVLGTNLSIIYFYDRNTHALQKLTPEADGPEITSVKVVSSIDYMVAAGDSSGVVTVFKIPKIDLDSLAGTASKIPPVERFTISGLHEGSVTALEWSLNSQNLFSGDTSGLVVFTEIDFSLNLTKTREVHCESFRIVQLSYSQSLQALVVSTLLRSVICYREASGWRPVQIGIKERSSLLYLGGVFSVDDETKATVVYCCRPGCRLWMSDLDGNVKKTILFKEALNRSDLSVEFSRIIKPQEAPSPDITLEFGLVYNWRDGLLVSCGKYSLIVVDPKRATVIAQLIDLKIVAHSVTENEIFIIVNQRDLIRLAFSPDLHDSSMSTVNNIATAEAVSGLPTFDFTPVTGMIEGLTNKFLSTDKISFNAVNTFAAEVMYGRDTTTELPPMVALHEGVPELRVDPISSSFVGTPNEREITENIKFEKHQNKIKSKNVKEAHIFEPGPSSPLSPVPPEPVHSIMACGVEELPVELPSVLFKKESVVVSEVNLLDSSLLTQLLPESRNLETIVEDNKLKEQLLEASLVFPSENETSSCSVQTECPINENNSEMPDPPEPVHLDDSHLSDISLQNQEFDHIVPNFQDCNLYSTNHSEEDVLNSNDIQPDAEVPSSVKEDLVEIYDEVQISEVATSVDADNEPTAEEEGASNSLIEINLDENGSMTSSVLLELEHAEPIPATCSSVYGPWQELSCPEKLISLSCSDSNLFGCSTRLRSYSLETSQLKDPTEAAWKMLNFKSDQLCVSSDGQTACKLHCKVAYYTRNWGTDRTWILLCKDVNWISVSKYGIWFINKGELCCLPSNSDIFRTLKYNKPLAKVFASDEYHEVVLVLTAAGQILSFNPTTEIWTFLFGVDQRAKDLCISSNMSAWLVDVANNVYVCGSIVCKKIKWWRVPVGNNHPIDISDISFAKETIFLYNALTSSIYFNNSYVEGHRWDISDCDLRCLHISAEGVFEDKGSVWLVTETNKLLCLHPKTQIPKKVNGMNWNLVCLASCPDVLWVLTDDGAVYVRCGISDTKPTGFGWTRLNSDLIEQGKLQLTHLSCSSDVVWACDIRGHVLMLVGSPTEILSSNHYLPRWVIIEGSPVHNNTFIKVYVGHQSSMVWALDSGGNVYVREGVFPDFLMGTGWLHVPGIKASELCISGESVWALSKEGVYRRTGVSQSSFIGDAWHFIPANLDHFSVSASDNLWGVCSSSGRLMYHSKIGVPMSPVDGEWTFL